MKYFCNNNDNYHQKTKSIKKNIYNFNNNNNNNNKNKNKNKNDKFNFKKSNSYTSTFLSIFDNHNNIKFVDKRNSIDQIIIKNMSIYIKSSFEKNNNNFCTFYYFDERIHNIFDYNYFNNFLWYDSEHNFYKTVDSLSISHYITYVANTINMCTKELITSHVIFHYILHSENSDIIKTCTFRILWLAICNLSIKMLCDDFELSLKWVTNQLKEKIFGLNVDILLKIEYVLLNILNYKLPQGDIYTIISDQLLCDSSYNFNVFD
tara:strand:+ start:5160 stop:5948 length:789 start_codon:yes stop_codon:yes gene_type:complete